jgi:hypothetical protein
MKRTIIISAILLFSVSMFGQRPSRERTRQEAPKKSETTIKHSADSRKRSPVTNTKRIENNNRNAHRTVNTSTVREGNRTIRKPGDDTRKPDNGIRKPVERTRKPVSINRQNPVNRSGYRNNNDDRTNYTPQGRHQVRPTNSNVKHYSPVSYKKVHVKYKAPKRVNVYWTHNMYRDYRVMYPDFQYWNYPIGYRILSVPAYNAYFHMGEVRNIYGRVHQIWYSWSTDEYYMYFGNSFPYQDFSVIIPGRYARKISRNPEIFLAGRYIWITGLVTNFEGKPEIIVRRKSQIHLY